MGKTSERIRPSKTGTLSERFMYQRHLYSYDFAKKNILEAKNILDLGCGTGYGSQSLIQKGKFVLGVDKSDDAIFESKKFAESGLKLLQSDITNLPLKNNSIDFISSMQVIEHITDVDSYLLEISRVLTPGGKFILSTPNRILRLSEGEKPWNKFHVTEYGPQELEKILKKHYPKVRVLGVTAKKEFFDMELSRINLIRTMIKYDPLKLHALLPESLKCFFADFIRGLVGKPKTPSDDVEVSKDDFSITDDYNFSMDLLAVAEK